MHNSGGAADDPGVRTSCVTSTPPALIDLIKFKRFEGSCTVLIPQSGRRIPADVLESDLLTLL